MVRRGRTFLLLVGLAALVVPLGASSSEEAGAPKPRLDVFRTKNYRSGDSELVVRFSGKIPKCIQNSRLIDAAVVKLVFKSKGIQYRLSNVWCAPTTFSGGVPVVLGYLRTWTERGDFFEFSPVSLSGRDFKLVPSDVAPNYLGRRGESARKTFVFGFWITINGKLARKGRLAVTLDFRSRVIREDEDDFINICINQSKRVYSAGGRLYCLSSWSNHSMRIVR